MPVIRVMIEIPSVTWGMCRMSRKKRKCKLLIKMMTE